MIVNQKLPQAIFLFLIMFVFVSVPNIAYCQNATALPESGGGHWSYRANIILTEPLGLARNNEPVELTFKSDKVKPQGEDIRITDANNAEVPYQIDITGNGTYKIYFFARCAPNSSNTYYLYFGNPNANKPDYGTLSSVLDNQNKSWHTDGALIEWGGRAGYDIPNTNVITTLKFDNNNDGNTDNDPDCLTDENAWARAFYGYLGSNVAGIPAGFGSADAQVVQSGPIFCELALGSARIRYFKNQHWIETNQYVDSMFCFDKTYQFMRQGLGSEEFIPDWGVRYDDDGTMYWLCGYDSLSVNPRYLALRKPGSGLIFGAVAENVARWSMPVKYASAWDRQISFDNSSNLPDAKIYWYSDTSNGYDGIERFSKQALNPLQVELQVDTEPPATTVSTTPESQDGQNGWFVTQPKITLSANEKAVTYYRINGGDWLTYSSPVSIPEGDNTLCYYSVDTFGNIEAAKTAGIKVDMSPPAAPQPLSPQNNLLTNNPTPAFSWSPGTDAVSGLSHYEIFVDGHPAVAHVDFATTNAISPKLADGSHSWFIRAYDRAGNYIDSVTYNLSIDTVPPVTKASINPESQDGENGWYKTSPTINLSENESGTTFYQIDSGDYRTYDSTITIPEGIHEFRYYSIDLAGNKEQEQSLQLKVDSSPPSIDAGVLPANMDHHYLAGEPITISYNATDTISGVSLLTANLNSTPIINGEQISLSKPGEYVLTIAATDVAGNTAAKTQALTVGYNFKWLPPIQKRHGLKEPPYQIKCSSTLPIKFSVSDYFGKFVSDTTVKVIISDGINSKTFSYGKGKGCVKINPSDENYLLNLHLKDYPWINPGGIYTIAVYFGSSGENLGILQDQLEFEAK